MLVHRSSENRPKRRYFIWSEKEPGSQNMSRLKEIVKVKEHGVISGAMMAENAQNAVKVSNQSYNSNND